MLDRFIRTKATPRQIYDVINGIPEEKPFGSTPTAEEIIVTLPEGVRRIVLKSPNKYLVFADLEDN